MAAMPNPGFVRLRRGAVDAGKGGGAMGKAAATAGGKGGGAGGKGGGAAALALVSSRWVSGVFSGIRLDALGNAKIVAFGSKLGAGMG
jgi:hypothetical protein